MPNFKSGLSLKYISAIAYIGVERNFQDLGSELAEAYPPGDYGGSNFIAFFDTNFSWPRPFLKKFFAASPQINVNRV